jgi:hypothetical protein
MGTIAANFKKAKVMATAPPPAALGINVYQAQAEQS